MFRRVIPVFFIFALFIPFSVSAVSKTVVINFFMVAGTKSTDEYIEIKNISPNTINLTGWQLAKITASGSKYNLVTKFESIDLGAGMSLTVGHKDSTTPIDIFYQTGYSVAEDNTIVLYSDSGKIIVDKVGFGKAALFEGTVLSTAGIDIWGRKDGIDTDNNASDFQKEGTTGTMRDYSGICLTEIMPDPGSGGEEWIEIYNSEITKDISGLVISDKLGSVKKYKIPDGTVIEEGKYLVFYAKSTGIALNNDGDGVSLLDSDGSILDDSGESYGKTKSGLSYAYDGEKWLWSKTPTPGAQNIITLDETAEAGSTKKTTAAKKPKATKGKAPKVEILGSTDENEDVFGGEGSSISESDRLLGIVLIIVALLGGLIYTIFINKGKLLEVFKKERKRYHKSWGKFRQKVQRRGNLSFIRRTWRREDPIYKRPREGP